MTSLEWVMELLDAVGSQPKGRAPRQCPAHEDAAPSLSLHDKGGVLYLFCHAGCDWRRVLTSLGCPGSVLHRPLPVAPAVHAREFCSHLTFPKLEMGGGHPSSSGFHLESTHRYGDRRLERWRHPVTRAKSLLWLTDTEDGLVMGLHGMAMHELPLYNEPDIRAGIALGEVVLLVESESSADALTKAGWYATTWAGSATSVPIQRLSLILGGYDKVIYIADMDDAGLRCAAGLRGAEVYGYLVIGRIGEDAKDLYGRVGADAFANLIGEVLNGDAEQRTQAG